MFIVFGWKKTVKPIESVLKTHCFHCNNSAGWSIWKETEWLSLFFVKTLPFLNKYLLACDICGDYLPLESKMAKQALDQDKRDSQLHDDVIQKIEDHQFAGMTQTQIEFRKSSLMHRR